MFLISVVLSVSLTTIFANPLCPYMNRGNPNLLPQQKSSTTQGDQVYAPSMPQFSMEGNRQMYPMPPPMMPPPPMMQGFQPPFPFNPMNQQQLSMLLMSSYARAMALAQLMNMQNRFQFYQPNQYSDPAINNYSSMPATLPQQPQVDLQNNLKTEMSPEQEKQGEPGEPRESELETSQQQGELQQQEEPLNSGEGQETEVSGEREEPETRDQDILEKRKMQRALDIEIERRERLQKRKAEENELERQQKEMERMLREEEEMKRQEEETKRQILEEERKEREEKEKDIKLRQEEELRFKKIEAEKKKRNQVNNKPQGTSVRRQRKQKHTKKTVTEDIIERL